MRGWNTAGIAVGALLTAWTAASACAQDRTANRGWYGEIGGAYISEDDFNTSGVNGRLGYAFGTSSGLSGIIDAVALESEVFYGIFGETQESSFGDVEAEIEYAVSGSVRAVNSITDRFDAFARLGVSYASAEVDVDSQFEVFDDSNSDTDLMFGVGGAFRFNWATALRGDFTLQNDLEVYSLTIHREF